MVNLLIKGLTSVFTVASNPGDVKDSDCGFFLIMGGRYHLYWPQAL